MTDTLHVPPQPGARDARPPTGAPAAAGDAARRRWRRVARRCALLPPLVTAPLVTVAPTGDHRFNVYWHGGMFADAPWRIAGHTLESGGAYLRLGNFRPLGRMLEKSLDLLAYLGVEQLGLPATVTLRLVACLAAVLLTAAVVVFAECLTARGRPFAAAPSPVAVLLPYAVAAGLVAAGPASTTVLFGGLYWCSTALVLLVAAVAARWAGGGPLRWWAGGGPLRWWAAAAVPAGAALAVVNELVYLAVPLATVAVWLRGRYVLGLPARAVATGAGARVVALLWAGFLPVFAAVRWVIRGHCADGGCYDGSDVTVSPAALAVLPVRMAAWVPPLPWLQAAPDAGPGRYLGLLPLAALAVLGVLAARSARDLRGAGGRGGAGDRRPPVALVLAAVALLAMGALPAALNADVQAHVARGAWAAGWRDSAVTGPAGALLLVAAAAAATRGGRRAAAGLLAVLTLLGAGSVAANRAYRDAQARTPAAGLDDRIALAVAGFDPSAAGDARRCALLTEVFTTYPDAPAVRRRYVEALNTSARHAAGVPFCAAVPS